MSGRDHNEVLKDAAKRTLEPLGLLQMGRSRTWLDDRIWYLIVVDFSPSSFSKGSYINVGANVLLYAKNHESFDFLPRGPQLFESAEEPNWDVRIAELARAAAKRVAWLRQEFSSMRVAADRLADHARGGWNSLYAGICYGLVGDIDRSREQLDLVVNAVPMAAWQHDLIAAAQSWLSLVNAQSQFRDAAIATIVDARARLNLPALTRAQVGEAVDRAIERRSPSLLSRLMGVIDMEG